MQKGSAKWTIFRANYHFYRIFGKKIQTSAPFGKNQWQQCQVMSWILCNLRWHNDMEPSPDELTNWQHLLKGISDWKIDTRCWIRPLFLCFMDSYRKLRFVVSSEIWSGSLTRKARLHSRPLPTHLNKCKWICNMFRAGGLTFEYILRLLEKIQLLTYLRCRTNIGKKTKITLCKHRANSKNKALRYYWQLHSQN